MINIYLKGHKVNKGSGRSRHTALNDISNNYVNCSEFQTNNLEETASDLPRRSRRIANRNGTNEQCPQWRVGQKLHNDQGEPYNEGNIIQVLKSNNYKVKWKNGLEQVLCSGNVEDMVTYHTNFVIKFNAKNEDFQRLLLEATENESVEVNAFEKGGENCEENLMEAEKDENKDEETIDNNSFENKMRSPSSVYSDASTSRGSICSINISLEDSAQNDGHSSRNTSGILSLCDGFKKISLRECDICRNEDDNYTCTFCELEAYLDFTLL